MKADQVFETVIYAANLTEVERFYKDVLGLEVLRSNTLMLAFRCRQGVLLIFDPEQSSQPGRSLPSHGAEGPSHLAFAVKKDELTSWRKHLKDQGVEIEHEENWDVGQSIYFRDPAGNSLELATPDVW